MPKDEVTKETKKKMLVIEEVADNEDLEREEANDKPQISEEVEASDTKTDETVEEVFEAEKPNYLWIIVPTALLVGALVGGLITYFSGVANVNKVEATPTAIATEIPKTEASPIATTASELKKSDIKIQVLNGSGVAGIAGKVKAFLEEKGYVKVDAGNASNQNFEIGEISVKKDKEDYVQLLTDDLSVDYEFSSETKTLSASSLYDVIITIGKK